MHTKKNNEHTNKLIFKLHSIENYLHSYIYESKIDNLIKDEFKNAVKRFHEETLNYSKFKNNLNFEYQSSILNLIEILIKNQKLFKKDTSLINQIYYTDALSKMIINNNKTHIDNLEQYVKQSVDPYNELAELLEKYKIM